MARFNIKELRRRSKASFRTNSSSDSPSNGEGTPNSSPTLRSITGNDSDPGILNHSTTSTESPQLSPPARSLNGRQSVSGMAGLGGPPSKKGSLPISQYAPRIANIAEGAWVYQKVLLVHGTVGESKTNTLNGTLTVTHLNDSFPPISWPVNNSQFKALIYLSPGPNRLRFDFASPKLVNSQSSNPIHASYLTIHMMAATNAPPLHLAIILGRDSEETFLTEGQRNNDLETAIHKFRMSAYLWQAFTAEQMYRNKLGRRVFRFDEEWTTGSASSKDIENDVQRSEARVHIIRSNDRMGHFEHSDSDEHHEDGQTHNLFSIVNGAVCDYFKPRSSQKIYVACMMLDSKYDSVNNKILGHVALGGNCGNVYLGIFGSHCMWSYPESLEGVVPAFTDCTPTDTKILPSDNNEGGSAWEALNIGIGAHLHEVGHLLGCPHQETGVMLRDYVTLNRTFVTKEAYCVRTDSKDSLVTQEDECGWHRLDMLRFRTHPCFRVPQDPPMPTDSGIHMFSIEVGSVVVCSASGVAFVEIHAEGDDLCRAWIEYPLENGSVQRQVSIYEKDLRLRLPENQRQGKIKVIVKSVTGSSLDVDNISQLCAKSAFFKIATGKMASRSAFLGYHDVDNALEEVFISSEKKERVMSKAIIYYEDWSVFGMEFVYDDTSSQLFGSKYSKEAVFDFDIRRGEFISGFFVRSGAWLDGIQIMTSLGRKSPLYGKATGGDPHFLVPPRGYTIRGVSGSHKAWLRSFSIIITK